MYILRRAPHADDAVLLFTAGNHLRIKKGVAAASNMSTSYPGFPFNQAFNFTILPFPVFF
jgi:hypothetical protein